LNIRGLGPYIPLHTFVWNRVPIAWKVKFLCRTNPLYIPLLGVYAALTPLTFADFVV